MSAVPWLVVFALSSAGSTLRVARELPGSQILAAGLGDKVPGLQVADPDEQRPASAPLVAASSGAVSIDPGFAPWPSPVGAGAAPHFRPVLPLAPKTSPPRSAG